MTPVQIARDCSTAAVAGIAAWSSWTHMVAVALRFGERAEVAYVLPVSVDGMLVVASTAMVEDQRAGRRVRWSARTAFAAGVAASVAANIAAAKPSSGARIVAAWPALALLLVVEILARAQTARRPPRPMDTERIDTPTQQEMPAPIPQEPDAKPATHVRGRSERAVDAVARLRAEYPQASHAELASAAGVSQRHIRRLLTDAPGAATSPTPTPTPTATADGQDTSGGNR
jgi:hypothetical protein